MKPSHRKGSIALTIVLALGAPSLQAAGIGNAPSDPKAWSRKMQDLYKTLASLMTDVSSDARFNDRKNRASIEKNAKKLSELAHGLGAKTASSPDKDPSVALLGKLFAEEAQGAYRYLKQGHDAYARERLRDLPAHCISCHTRTQSGPQFAALPLEPSVSGLRGTEKGEFFAATRQYDRALKEFQAVISDPASPRLAPIEWNRAIQNALVIAVRVKRDPQLSLELAEQVIASKEGPLYIRENAKAWRESILGWKRETPRTLTSEEGLHSEAVRLLSMAHETQKYPTDRNADVWYLRASAAVHDLLQAKPSNPTNLGQAFLMAGICYEVLQPLPIGEIHEIYFEACIRANPHTPLAEACYSRYEQSVYLGFTGSSGTHLPEDMRSKLRSLRMLANPESKSTGQIQ